MPKLLEQEGQAQSVISGFSWAIVEYFLQKDISLPRGLFLYPLSLVIHPEPPEVGKIFSQQTLDSGSQSLHEKTDGGP